MVIMQERPQEKKETDVQKNRGKTPDQFPSHFLSSGLQIPLLWTLWGSILYEFVPASRANEHSPGDGDPHWGSAALCWCARGNQAPESR